MSLPLHRARTLPPVGDPDRPLRLLLLNGIDIESGDLYDDIGARLRARGLDVDVLHETPAPLPEGTEPPWDVAVTNYRREDVATHARVVFGGTPQPRPTTLGWLEDAGVATMDWATASSRRDVWRLLPMSTTRAVNPNTTNREPAISSAIAPPKNARALKASTTAHGRRS